MRWRKFRFNLATIMIVIAVLAIALAIIEPVWNRQVPIDPFDATEMLPAPPFGDKSPAKLDFRRLDNN
jgi:hypothetical protein